MADDLSPQALRGRLLAHLHEIVRERDAFAAPEGHAAVKAYLRTELSRFAPVDAHRFDHRGRPHDNLVADLPGTTRAPPILVAAHYDAVPGSPGADDNGTALAVLLEIARHFASQPPRRPLRLVAFDLEEHHQAGSRAYAEQLRRNDTPLALMLSLEMLGYCARERNSQRYPGRLDLLYPDRGDFIGLIGNLRTLPTLRRLAQVMRQEVPCEYLPVPFRGRVLPDSRRSDHAPFWDLGYNAIMVTDTANLRNPHYHQPSDGIETLDLDFLAKVCRAIIRGLASL
jgi:Zn-dependent M28 family amino/carboxypeptidase